MSNVIKIGSIFFLYISSITITVDMKWILTFIYNKLYLHPIGMCCIPTKVKTGIRKSVELATFTKQHCLIPLNTTVWKLFNLLIIVNRQPASIN